MEKIFNILGMVGAIGMPIFNIPFMIRVIRRRSAKDISLGWLFGIWGCIMLMLPSSLVSPDPVLRAFGACNAVMFSCVVVVVMYFRQKKYDANSN
jgi:hypothetical protein